MKKYELDYSFWLDHSRAEFANFYNQLDILVALKNIDKEAEINILFEQLYYCLTHLVEAELFIDMGPVKPVIFSCRFCEYEEKSIFIITCTLKNLEELHLYMFPNTTPCPRSVAFVKTLEKEIN